MSLEVLFWRNPHLSVLFIAHLPSQLPDTVNELNKNRGAVGICVVLITVSNTLEDMIHLRTISDEIRQAPTFLSREISKVCGEKFVYQLEAVTKTQPFFLKQHLKTTNGSVITVQHKHGQGGQLTRAVPTVTAVHHHWGFSRLHLVCNPQRSCQNQL